MDNINFDLVCGITKCFIGLALMIAGVVGLFARLKPPATRSTDRWNKRGYSHRTRCG